MALLSFVAFLLVIKLMPSTADHGTARQPPLLGSLKQMMCSGQTRGILLARYATMIIMVPTMAFLPLLATQWAVSSGLMIGMIIACRTLVNAVFQVPFGRLADRVDKRRMLLVGCLALSVIVYWIPSLPGFLPMALGYCLLGLAEAAVWAALGAYASIEAKRFYGHGTMMGVFSFAMSAGVFTGAMLAGWSMDAHGIGTAYRVCAMVVLVLSATAIVMLAANHDYDGEASERDQQALD
jgi:MFS family permease